MSSSHPQIIRKSSFIARPWKNGGGITHDAFRDPACGDPFRWRISVAHIDASGPFSDFVGYQRTMVLLRGPGLSLQFPDGSQRDLRNTGEMVQFDGSDAVHCHLHSGPCIDLNLMVSHAVDAEVAVLPLGQKLDISPSAHRSTLVFGIQHPLMLYSGRAKLLLEPWDLAILTHTGGELGRVDAETAPTAVFVAAIHH